MIRSLLNIEQQKKIAEINEYFEKRLIEFKNMKTGNFISSIKYFMSQMERPAKFKVGEPVYDSTFWYVILPEMIRRLELLDDQN